MKKIIKQSSFTLAAFLCWLYIKFVALTSRIINIGMEIPGRLAAEKRGFIYAIWHNRQFFMTYPVRNTGYYALISRSEDGEYIDRIFRLFGIFSVRGSTSKGGARALVRIIRLIESGKAVAITPDGPRGPVYEVQPGIIMAAKKTGCPVIPVSCALIKKIEFSSWDKYQFPLPFNKIAVKFGEPFYISSDENNSQASLKIKEQLDKVTADVENLVLKI